MRLRKRWSTWCSPYWPPYEYSVAWCCWQISSGHTICLGLVQAGRRIMPKHLTRLAALLCVVVAFASTGCEQARSAGSSLKEGAKAPVIQTKTLADVGGDFSRITTYRYPDERMYQYSLDDALRQGKPIVLEFAPPGHCTVCDVQLQMLKAMLAKNQGNVIFLQMGQNKNQGAIKAFLVKGDPWTFIIDIVGIGLYKQPGRMLYGELDGVISRVLKDGVG